MYKNVSFNFEGKRALVTGGARGIGREIALALARAGAQTFVLDINKEGLATLTTEHPSIHSVCVDLRDWDATRKAVESITPIDLLVNDAAIMIRESFLDAKVDSLDETLSVNTKAPMNICQIVAKDLKSRNRAGSIVNITSNGTVLPIHNGSTYCMSKAALDMLTKAMAAELGQYQIRVNSVLPTLVKTELGKPVWGDPQISRDMLARIPLDRFAEVEDIAGPVLFLLSDASSMIHGHQMLVDGGHCIS